MSEFDHFADELADEVLAEMADNYFSSRRAMDDQLERFQRLVRELSRIQSQVEHQAEILHYALLGQDGAAGFYDAIGLDPETLPLCLDCTVPPVIDGLPFALTKKGRFIKLVDRSYTALSLVVDDFLHGHEYTEQGRHGRKRISVHYEAIVKLANDINRAIEKMNRDSSISGQLQYMRSLDPAGLEREKVAGAPVFLDPQRLDKEFDFKPVSMDTTGLKAFPALPRHEEVRDKARAYCDVFYSRNKEKVASMLDELRQATRKAMEKDEES